MTWPVTTLVAVYGAILATGNLAWTIWRHRRDAGRVRVTFELRNAFMPGRDRAYVLVHIANIGTRPITARRLIGQEPRSRHRPWRRPDLVPQYVSDRLPRTLEPEGSTTLWPPLFGWDFDGLAALYVEDQSGKLWPVSRKQLRHGQQLNAEARRWNPDHHPPEDVAALLERDATGAAGDEGDAAETSGTRTRRS